MREHSRDYGRLEDILKYARNVLTKCQTLCEHFVSIILTPRVTQENVAIVLQAIGCKSGWGCLHVPLAR